MNTKRLLLPLAAAAIATLLLPTSIRPAYACSCAPFSTQGYVDNADTIVIGTVLDLVKGTESGPAFLDLDALVSVERYLKGLGPSQIVADDPPHGGLCGYFDQSSVGQRYLLFLRGTDSPFKTSLCSGNAVLPHEPSTNDLLREVQSITGPGLPPQAGGPPALSQPDADAPWLAIGLGVASGVIFLLASSVFLLRRRIISRR